jgi:hypothetical protein
LCSDDRCRSALAGGNSGVGKIILKLLIGISSSAIGKLNPGLLVLVLELNN